ncbi:MAG: TonB family protein [Bacteroidota bacterium]
MKQKYHIVDEEPKISDEEIEAYKNFGEVLKKHKAGSASVKGGNSIYRIGGAILIVILVSILGYWMWNTTIDNESISESTTIASNEIKQKETDPVQSIASDKDSLSDQSVVEEENEQMPEKDQELSTQNEEKVSSVSQSSEDEIDEEDKPSSNSSDEVEYNYQEAEPVEGFPALYSYFEAELTYPIEAVQDSIEGVVLVEFLIDKKGQPSQIKIMQSLGGLFDKESIRVIEGMPSWKPATINGIPVNSKMHIPLTFQIEE